MIRPFTPKVNFLVKSKNVTKPLKKIITQLFVLLHLVFALDFGFLNYNSRRIKIVVKIFSFVQLTALFSILCYAFFVLNPNPSSLWYLYDVLVYYSFGLLLLVAKNSYYDFQLDLHSFDTAIEVDSNSYKVYIPILGFLFVIAFRLNALFIFSIIYSEYNDFSCLIKCAYFIAVTGQNVSLLVYSLLFQSTYTRMKRFTAFVSGMGVDVVSCQYLYKNIVEVTERAKRSFDLILVIALIYATINITLTTYLPFSDESIRADHMPLAYVLVAQELVMMFAPAFTAGLVSSQVESLRLVLYDRLVKDHKDAKDIKRFISYVEARPLRFKVWMVIPLDWTLPVIVINISVTYLIVMIQFTRK